LQSLIIKHFGKPTDSVACIIGLMITMLRLSSRDHETVILH